MPKQKHSTSYEEFLERKKWMAKVMKEKMKGDEEILKRIQKRNKGMH